MDRTEITKHIERAEKLLQKGKPAEALQEYQLVLTAEPENDAVCQMAADLCLSLQRIPAAVKMLGEMFERQVQAGDGTRASLTYKKLARFVNPTWDQKMRFAQLLEKSNRKMALETYENAFQELVKQKQKQESVGVLERILALDPSTKNYQRLGELSSELGNGKAAAAAFLKVAELAQMSGGGQAQWIERAYSEDTSDPGISLAYAKSLLEQGQAGAAIFVLEAQVIAGGASEEMREIFANSLLSTNRLTDAEPVIWGLFEENPSRVQEIAKLIALYIDATQDDDAVRLARKLEDFQRRRGDRRAFLAMMQEILAKHRPSAGMLEFMCEQFNASNREADYCQTLIQLFDLYYNTGNYAKAADCLDRAAEVDAYETGHQKRLEMLRGKIDENRFKVVSSRFSSMSESTAAPVRNADTMLGAAALQDLMLQAEILVQYGMRSKAIERLQRIQELFPREEERNPALQQLYLTAGVLPQYSGSQPPAAAPVITPTPTPPAQPAASPVHPQATDVSSFTKVAEITRKLYRQGNADAVLATAAREIGSQWQAIRCVVAMRKPGSRSTNLKQYCNQDYQPAKPEPLEKVIATAHDAAIAHGTLSISDTQSAPELQSVREFLGQMSAFSLLAVPMSDGAEPAGILLLMHNTVRTWNPNDALVLKTISDQIVIAINNAGLRQLVKNLSVTDERSGLLKRASYLDLLMAETKRNLQQSTPLTILLMRLGEKSAMLKELGESGLEATMQQVGQLFAGNIRQNDLAFRYEMTTIAIVLGETAAREAVMAAEKLQKLLAQVKMPEGAAALRFNAGLAQAVLRTEFDPVDIVTEVINRAEQALYSSIGQGPATIVGLDASIAAAAVA